MPTTTRTRKPRKRAAKRATTKGAAAKRGTARRATPKRAGAGLAEYNRKRDFTRTAEPPGTPEARGRAGG